MLNQIAAIIKDMKSELVTCTIVYILRTVSGISEQFHWGTSVLITFKDADTDLVESIEAVIIYSVFETLWGKGRATVVQPVVSASLYRSCRIADPRIWASSARAH